MAYDKQKLIEQSLAAIKKHKLIFIEEVVSFLPCDKTTFYRHECNECNAIKEAIESNKIATKSNLRGKWEDSDNAALNIALYKLCATPKELDILTVQKNKNETKKVDGDKDKTLKELREELRGLGYQRSDKG